MARPRRSPLALAAFLLLVGGSIVGGPGCAARGRRAAHEGTAVARSGAATGDLVTRPGYASFGPNVRLRDDTPMLTPLLEASRAADAPAPAYGPQGATGEPVGGIPWSDPYPVYANGCGPCYGAGGGYPGCGPGTGYYAPGGAVWPGLRPPPPPEVTSPFAAPFRAPAGSDVSQHRPGLSTGTGVYGRSR